MGGSSFTAGEESVTLDFANAEITKNDESIELSDLAEGDILTVEVGSSNTAASATVESVGGGQSFGGSGEVTQGTVATTICEDGTYSGESYTSNGDDENALRDERRDGDHQECNRHVLCAKWQRRVQLRQQHDREYLRFHHHHHGG